MKVATLNGGKRGRGRPCFPRPLDRVSVVVGGRMTVPDVIRMRRAAEALGITESEFVRRAVLAALEAFP